MLHVYDNALVCEINDTKRSATSTLIAHTTTNLSKRRNIRILKLQISLENNAGYSKNILIKEFQFIIY